ncbi:MAG TPA: HEAT repeat domain-containing protein [Planctomycetota bacterium]|nr:HEAT repeat domain-containing protein [Planctomycetota bacterium]
MKKTMLPGLFLSLTALLSAAEDAPSSPAARIAPLLPGLSSGDPGDVERSNRALERLVFAAGRPGAESERSALALALGDLLGDGVPVPARLLLLRAIETVGKGEVIPALSTLLAKETDPLLLEGARRALEANPHVNAKRELRKALASAEGPFRIALVRSIGARRDFLATGDLIVLADEAEPDLKTAALDALALIGDISAVPLLESALVDLEGPARAAAERAYLRLADSLVRNGERGAARRIYDRAMGMGPSARAAALLGFARAGLQSEVKRIAEALGDPDRTVAGAAREAAAVFPSPGETMTKALLERLEGKKEPERGAILEVLARRPESAAIAAVIQAARDTAEPASRAAAIRLLAGMPGAGSAALEVHLAALDAKGEPAAAAEEALAGARDPGVTRAVAAALPAAEPARRASLVRILGARRDPAAAEVLNGALGDPSIDVRLAALTALGRIGDPSSAPLLLRIVREGDDTERTAAAGSLARLRGREAGEAIAKALESEKGPARAVLLRAAGARGEPWAMPFLAAAATDGDAGVRLAALEGLARTGDASILPILVAAASEGPGDARAAALRGCIRIAGTLPAERSAEAAAIYVRALDSAPGDGEKGAILRGIGETGGLEHFEKLRPSLEAGPLRRVAGRAALRLAERLPEGRQAEARGVYERILEADPDDATARQCVRRLRRLGVEVDPARKAGFVTRWWVLAPLPDSGGALLTKTLPPEEGVDVKGTVSIEGNTYTWRVHQVTSPRGLLLLDEAGYGQSSAGAYLYAEVSSKETRDVLLKLGSDDQVVCWLNGKKLHSSDASRGLEPDQDTIEARLTGGLNRILLKVINTGGPWGACLRITDREGKPLALGE